MWSTLVRARAPACAWCREATTSEPDVSVRVCAHVPGPDGRVLEEAELTGPGWREKVQRIAALASVQSVDVLESNPEHARIRLRVEACPLPNAILASGVLPRFPFEVHDGFDQWLLIGDRDAGARFVESLKDQKVHVEVISTREYRPHAGLTDRQRERMDAAIAQGYYEVPRRVTLTELARRLKVAKSTLSETLARGERHVLEAMQHRP